MGVVRFIPPVIALGALLAIASCGGSTSSRLITAASPSFLGLQSDPAAFNTVAGGAGLAEPLPAGGGVSCAVVSHQAFIPPGQTGEAAGGEGVTFTYAEVLSIEWRCQNVAQARMGYGVLAKGATSVSGVADEAEVLSVGNEPDQGFPNDHVYMVKWRKGEFVGALQLVGPQSDGRVTPDAAESLARWEASNA